jgi:hypothetical protein
MPGTQSYRTDLCEATRSGYPNETTLGLWLRTMVQRRRGAKLGGLFINFLFQFDEHFRSSRIASIDLGLRLVIQKNS